jgi:hypothetical protein
MIPADREKGQSFHAGAMAWRGRRADGAASQNAEVRHAVIV